MQSQPTSKQKPFRQWLSILLLLALLLTALPGTLLAGEEAKPSAQEEAVPILLGEYVQQQAGKDDLLAYVVYFPEDGEYMISPDDEEAAADFTAAIMDEEGEMVYEGPLSMDAITLAAGEYRIEITALEENVLSFFVLGMIGGMSDSERSPGKLYPGSVYVEEDVSDTRYATIAIPDLGYPQEVLLFFKVGEGDSFTLSVNGGTVSKYASSDDGEMVRFYSEGGSYSFSVDPLERRSEFTAIVFLAGAPVTLEADGALEATLAADTDTQIFRLHVDDVYDDIKISAKMADDSESELSMSVVDRYEEGIFYVYAETLEDGSLSAATGPLLPGDYYVVVTSYDGLETNYTISAEGTPGAPMIGMALGEAVEGSLEEGGIQYHRLEGVLAGSFVRIALSSDTEGDFDLHAGMTQPLDQWSSTSTGADEEVILVAPQDGVYYVKVSSYSGAGDYELVAEEIADVGLIDTNRLILQSIDENGFIVYGFAIDEPGQLLSVLVASENATDLDLSVVHFGSRGARVHDLSSASPGSSEIVSQAAADPGIYEVRVKAFGEGGEFGLLVRVENPASLLRGTPASVPAAILTDDFSDEESGWPIDPEGMYGYEDDIYFISADPGMFHLASLDEEAYTDVILEIDLSLLSGDPKAYAGLICRTTEDSYYFADISPNGDFSIGQVVGKELITLSDWDENAAIDTTEGAVNRLRLECVGDSISAYVNGELLDSVSVEPSSGGFGMEAGNPESATEPALFGFDNLVVSQP
ncbi:MAG: hypothetical protein KJZ86_06725 [Caldilineaceae bacterium]|nr:hypothetical protein [Caldilineaceae bacterium]